MAYSLYTRSFGASKANSEVTITQTGTGTPAIILSSSTGGVLNHRGKAKLDGSGNLSVYVDTSFTYNIEVNDPTPPRRSTLTVAVEDNSPTQFLDEHGNVISLPASLTTAQQTAGAVGILAASSLSGGSIINPDGSTLTINAAAMNALGLPLPWNASTNTPTLTSGVTGPTDNCYIVSVAGTTALDGISTWGVGDLLYFNGTWQKISNTALGITTTSLLKGDGAGNLTVATAGVDYAPAVLSTRAVPIGVTSGGVIGANGALTSLTTAFTTTYSDGVWLYFPANAINTGSAAGFYWTVMSGTSAGTIYQEFLSAATPNAGVMDLPSTLTPWSGTTGSTYTMTPSTSIWVPGVTIKANSMGRNGSLTSKIMARYNNSATNKGVTQFFNTSGSLVGMNVIAGTTAQFSAQQSTIYNRGVTNRQIVPTAQDTVVFGYTLGTVDTTVDVVAQVRFFMAAATDWAICEFSQLTLTPSF